MKQKSAIYMKRLRATRRRDNKCIRCGKPLSEDEKLEGYRQCIACREYKVRHHNGEIPERPNTTYFYNRKWKKDSIKKPELAKFMIENSISISSLASKTGLSTKTINRLLYKDLPYSNRTKNAINTFVGYNIL